MRRFYASTLLALAALVAGAPGASAQDFTECPTDQAECVVDFGTFQAPILNALRNTIVNDTDRPADRVYVLQRGGNYYITDPITYDGFDLRIVGEEAPDSGNDFGPALIQRVANPDAGTEAPGQMFLVGTGAEDGETTTSGLVLSNVWLQGETGTGGTGAYEPIQIFSTNSYHEFDNVVFDQNEWHHVSFKNGSNGNTIVFRNNTWRNQVGAGQLYIGRGFRIEGSQQAMLIVENNSFFNISSFPFQVDNGATVDYVLFNHNTVVNSGLSLASGNTWKRAYFTNNVFLNPFYQGESAPIYNQDNREGEFSGYFDIAPLPAGLGLEANRRIVLANNLYYLNEDIRAIHDEFDVRTQPLVSDSTLSYTTAAPYVTAANGEPAVVIRDNITDIELMLANSPYDDAAVQDSIRQFIAESQEANAAPTPLVFWDPGVNPDPLFINFPRPEDFSYDNDAVESAGTDGLPLGDLNWFPGAKDDYLANRESYVTAIENITGGDVEEPTGTEIVEAENGTPNGSAEVVLVEGDASIYFEGAGFAQWTFEVPADGTYGLNITTDLRGSDPRGERVLVDGNGLLNSTDLGELLFCTEAGAGSLGSGVCPYPLDTNDGFTVYELRADQLIDDDGTADVDESTFLDLTAGTHTLRIEPVWGYQAFGTIEVVDASGAVVDTLPVQEATTRSVTEECPEEVAFCPQGFATVSLDAGGEVAIPFTLPAGNLSVLPSIVYTSPSGGSGELFINGGKAADLNFAATTAGESGTVDLGKYTTAEGAGTITIRSSTGGVEIDYISLAAFASEGDPVATEELPEGWALGLSYPNPTAGAATIEFRLATPAAVQLHVYDVLGRRVTTLADGELAAGPHQVRIPAGALASGTYIYRLQTPVGTQTRRLTVVR